MAPEGARDAGGRVVNFPASHVFRPPPGPGLGIGAGAAAVALIVGLALLLHGLTAAVSFASFASDVVGVLLLLAGAMFAYWAYALYSLRYIVDGDALIIVWGLTRQVIPVDAIERIVLGRKYGEPELRGVSWPGCHIGRGRTPRIGSVLFYSAHRSPADIVYVATPAARYGISLSDARGLARTVQAAQETAVQTGEWPSNAPLVVPGQSLLLDPAALLMAAIALVAFLIAAGYIYARYPSLPSDLQLPYPAVAGPARTGTRSELVRLPETALLWLLLGLGLGAAAHIRLRAVSYTLLAGAAFAECLYAIAALAAAH